MCELLVYCSVSNIILISLTSTRMMLTYPVDPLSSSSHHTVTAWSPSFFLHIQLHAEERKRWEKIKGFKVLLKSNFGKEVAAWNLRIFKGLWNTQMLFKTTVDFWLVRSCSWIFYYSSSFDRNHRLILTLMCSFEYAILFVGQNNVCVCVPRTVCRTLMELIMSSQG